jgi:hypothetical protein
MTITRITDTTPVCYGVMCEQHADCARYRAVDRMPSDAIAIGTCGVPPATERPLFIPVKAAA